MRKLLLIVALGATLFATTTAPTPAEPAPVRARTVEIQPNAAPWEPAPVKQTPAPSPLFTMQFRRRKRYVLQDDYRPTYTRPAAHRYNRSARRHAQKGWRRSGY